MSEPADFLEWLARKGESEATGERRAALYETWRTWDAPDHDITEPAAER